MKYKSFKISLALASGLLLLSGCGDALDITPDGRMTQTDVFNNIDYTESYVNSMYEGIRKYGVNYHYFTFLAVRYLPIHGNSCNIGTKVAVPLPPIVLLVRGKLDCVIPIGTSGKQPMGVFEKLTSFWQMPMRKTYLKLLS